MFGCRGCGARDGVSNFDAESERESGRFATTTPSMNVARNGVREAMRQASVSLTLGVFIGSALTSGICVGIAAAWLANEKVLRRLRVKAVEAFSQAREAALSTREGQALQRVLLESAGEEFEDLSAADATPAVDLSAPITSFKDSRLTWASENGEPGGSSGGGKWKSTAAELYIEPPPGLDYWCRTFYTPLLCKTDGQSYVAAVGATDEATLTTSFSLYPAAQFDQAGIMVLVDEKTWCKAGIEYVDGVPRLACVVTNGGYSDWSTSKHLGKPAQDGAVQVRLRISKLQPGAAQGGCLVFEAAMYNTDDWQQVRIASLRGPTGKAWRMGVYAQSPIGVTGRAKSCSVRFHGISMGPKVKPVHEADLPEGHGGL